MRWNQIPNIVDTVKKILPFLFLYFLLATVCQSQIDIPRPSKAKKTDDKVWISNERDMVTFSRYLKKYGQPQTILFAKGVDANLFFTQYPFLDEVSQLVLEGNNPVNPELFCDLPSLTHVLFHISRFDSAWLNAINNCGYLTEISYLFPRDREIDERWFHLDHIETLNILGIFSKVQMEGIVPKIKPITQLNQVRFSTDFTKDLPSNLNELSQVQSFGMIDNLSFLQTRTFHDLAVENHYLNYWDKDLKKSVVLGFDYFSDRVTLEDYDFDYLSSLFYDAQFLPYYSVLKTEDTPLNTPKVQQFKDGLSDYSYYDTSNRSIRPEPYFELNKNISNFNPNYKPNYEHFVISPLQNAALVSKLGYKITIPANAFATLDKTACSKNIDLYFRIITNPVEVGLTGFPTKYDSFNDYIPLNNMHVVMLYGSCNNFPIQLKKGFAIDIEMPSSSGRNWELSTDMDYWYPYDPLENGGLTRYKINSFTDTFGPQQLVDFSTLNERYYDPKYYYLLDKNDVKVKIPRTLKKTYKPTDNSRIYYPYQKGMSKEKNEFYLKPGKSLVGVRKISFRDTARRHHIYFRLYNKVDDRLFPELKAFKKYLFQYIGDEPRKTFTKHLLRGKRFHDVRVFWEPGAKTGLVELKYEDGYVQLPFTVVQDGSKKSKEKQMKQFSKCYEKYKSKLERRAQVQQIHTQNYNLQVNDEKPSLGGTSLFTIAQLGTYCQASLDTSQSYSNINLLINNGGGIPLDVQKIMVVYKDPNQVDYFYNKAIQLNFDREFAIIAIDYKGDMYYLTASQCLALKGGEGSVKSINARLVKPDFSVAKLLYKNLGYKKRRK